MIEIRLRRASETVARHLCMWDASDLDALIPTIEAWGIAGDTADMVGQFQLEPTAAYFEVIIDDDDDNTYDA